jgi:hypothetical protein
MDATVRNLIQLLHQAPQKWVLAITGGGTGAVAQILQVPGGSRTVLEVVVPYHEEALTDFLGYRPEQYCSAATSQALARRARERAHWLAPGEAVLGLGCTASLVTDRPERGEHRFHLAIASADGLLTTSLTLSKGTRDREGEEAVLDAVLLNAMAQAAGVPQRLELALLSQEKLAAESTVSVEPLLALVRGEIPALCQEADGRLSVPVAHPALVLPGAFHPVHEGHWRMAAAAARICNHPTVFELSITNVDKPPLPLEEVRRRLSQFTWRAPLWVTRAPTFVEKAALFPGAVFVVGADTAERIVAPRYYQASEARLAEAMASLRRQGCRFLVGGREDRTGKFVSCADLEIPGAYRNLFAGIPESEFRVPISSTQLRAEAPASDPRRSSLQR